MARVSRKHCKSIGKSYRKKASNGRKASCVKSVSKRRSPRKASRVTKRRSPRKSSRVTKRRSTRKSGSKRHSPRCPPGQVSSYTKLADGTLGKRTCVPKMFQGKAKKNPTLEKEAEATLFEPFENPFGTEMRIRRRSHRSKRHSKRRSHKRRSHRKY